MKRGFLFVSLLACLLAGCGEPPNGKVQTPLLQIGEKPVPAPDSHLESDLWLIGEGGKLQVGTAVDVANKVFPKPDSRRAVAFRDLPPGFGPGFRSEGWETDAEGFGVISNDGRVVAAVRTELGVAESRVQDVLRKYEVGLNRRFRDKLPLDQPTRSNSWARYWFVEDESSRLMICAVRLRDGVLNITEAIGTQPALDAMRMSEPAAKNDLERSSAAAKPN